jgi:hypothetical protein
MVLDGERFRRFLNTIQSGMPSVCLLAALIVAGCTQSETSTPRQSNSGPAAKSPASDSMSQTDTGAVAMPPWVEASKSWPDTMRLTLNPSEEVTLDGLLLRLKLDVSQDVTGLDFENEKPILAEVLMTVRPVPEWDLARYLTIDSLNLRDPVRGRELPSLPMLSFRRSYDNRTARTQYLLNMAERFRISPDLGEGQLLEPTLYLSWGERVIIVKHAAVKLRFVEHH